MAYKNNWNNNVNYCIFLTQPRDFSILFRTVKFALHLLQHSANFVRRSTVAEDFLIPIRLNQDLEAMPGNVALVSSFN